MLLIRLVLLIAAVLAATIWLASADEWWVLVLAATVHLAATIAMVAYTLHYTSAGEWLGPSEEAQLEEAGLVEAETGLPKRRRWNAQRSREYAEEVARRGLVAVPEGWRGPDGAHRVLLVATTVVSPQGASSSALRLDRFR